MFPSPRRMAHLAVVAAALILPREVRAQVATVEACTTGALANCATIRLSSQLGIGPGGLNLFEIALQNLGSQAAPSLATSLYFLSFATGQKPVDPENEVDAVATPTPEGGAAISDASTWSIFESGDAIFLSALGSDGIGGCASSPAVGGYGQMARTCGDDQFVTFSFFTSRAFDVNTVALSGLEVVGLADGNPSDFCNDAAACKITPVTATPEPATMVLMLTGLAGLAGLRFRRRLSASALATTTSEA